MVCGRMDGKQCFHNRRRKSMNLPNDPIMLYSTVNVKLRDYYSDLDMLCEDLDVDKEELISKLAAAGFEYHQEHNRFE